MAKLSETDARGSRATIVDVARAAGVSRQTVSNVLNSPERVAPATLARVTREIDRMRFTPNVTARQLRRRRASAIGFEVNSMGTGRLGHIVDEFFVRLTMAAPVFGSHVVSFAPNGSVIDSYRSMIGSGLVDGFVLAETRYDDPRPAFLLDQGIPFVTFGRIWDNPEVDGWVDIDGRAGVREAVRHLADSGYAEVGFLGWPSGSPVGDDRRQGWLDGLEETGLARSPIIAEVSQDPEQATQAAARLIEQMGVGGAIACASDVLAVGALRAIRNLGLAAGRDIGLVGFDDSEVAEALLITSVHQPLTAAAETTWRLLMCREPDDRTSALLAPRLSKRASTSRTDDSA